MWKFSTAKLESRGKVMKGIVRGQSSARPEMFGSSKIKKRKTKRGGVLSKPDKRTAAEGTQDFYMVKGHRNNQCRTVLAKMTVSESRKLSRSVGGAGRRGREQLLTLGKLDRLSSVKKEHNVPERWTGLVPESTPFTVEALFKAMVTGLIQPLYDINGKHACE